MISKRIKNRKDGKSSASDSLRYGEGLKIDRETGELLDKSHRTRLGNFGLVDDGVYIGRDVAQMSEVINLAAIEMQANCDQNTKVGADKKLAHFVVSYNQEKPSEAVLRDTEDSMLAAMTLDKNHFATFLHNDNGYWHLHIFASRIEKTKPHRGNSLWHDQIKRDRVCREVEARHGLQPDNGMHRFNELGQVVEIPRAERQAARAAKPVGISDRAKTAEIYSGEKSFQTWANEIRIGDRLKHAKSWNDLHAAAAAYGCEVKEKGAGFVLCPAGQKGGISLSKLGLNKLPARYGAFQNAAPGEKGPSLPAAENATPYEPGPRLDTGKSHYARWKEAKGAFRAIKTDRANAQRDGHALTRQRLRAQHKTELAQIRATTPGPDKFAAVSIAKMAQIVALAALNEQFAQERRTLLDELARAAPGNTFRDFLVIQAAHGDNVALGLARRYGRDEATDVLWQREAEQLRIVAAVRGHEYRPTPRLPITHQIARSGTVIYHLGSGRTVTDSAIARTVQLNDAAAHSPEAIGTALRFAISKFGNTLTLNGSDEFQRLAVETAVSQRLGIKFADPKLESYRAQLEADRATARAGRVPDFSHLTPEQIEAGVSHVINIADRRPPEHIVARNARAAAERERLADDLARHPERAAAPEADEGRGLHELPAGSLDAQRRDAGVLLPDALHGGLADSGAGQDTDVRRTGAGPAGSGIERDTSAENRAAEHASRSGAGVRRGNSGIRAPESVIPKSKTPREAIPLPLAQQPDTAAIDYLADIQQQIEAAKAAANRHSMLAHSKTTEADHDAPGSGVIVASNEQFVAVQQGQSVKRYRTLELSKRMTYDGLDAGAGRFAPGNEFERKNGPDGMRTLLTEHREHMKTDAERERERRREDSRGI